MVIINIIGFFVGLALARKNPFALLFLMLLFVFCYARYVVSFFVPSYELGAREWVFPGASSYSIATYDYVYTIVQGVVVVSFVALKKVSIQSNSQKMGFFFYLLIFFAVVLLAFKGYILTSKVFSEGYLEAVDSVVPVWLGVATSSVSKPLCIALLLYFFMGGDKRARALFFLLVGLMALSWQRKDMVSMLLLFFGFYCVSAKLEVKKYIYSICVVSFFAFLMFYLREGDLPWSGFWVLDMLWATGISLNSGLFVVENAHEFSVRDSLGFPVTYFFCGLGRLFSDICYSPERLEYPGFLLEKISSRLIFETETIFGGLGGNLIGSIYIAAGFGGGATFTHAVALLLITLLVAIFSIIVLNTGFKSVLGALFIVSLIISSRYAFDGLIPPLNQIFFAVFIDIFFLRINYFKIQRGVV